VIVGAPGYDNDQTDEGRAFVYHGSASGLSVAADWTAESDQASTYFGYSVGTAGDVNGDGYSDVIVGAPGYDNDQTDEGRAFVYYGNPGSMSLVPRQRMANHDLTISPQARSDSSSSFRLALLGRTPFGRAKVKLQWEVRPRGTLFNGVPTGQSAGWIDTGTTGTQLNELVSGLSANTLYHWRVRLYSPVTTPFQSFGRWLTIPTGGWNEADLRTKCALAGDLTGDCHVDTFDLAIFCSQWLASADTSHCIYLANLTVGDCLVNFKDLALLAQGWRQ
jgi:hypothetical protein